MSTFEKVRRRIEKDMDAIQVHTPESWATILLTNTRRLKDEKEQAKFWTWMSNPEEEDIEAPKLVPCTEPTLTPKHVTVTCKAQDDEKEGDIEVELENTFERNGMVLVCRTKPV